MIRSTTKIQLSEKEMDLVCDTQWLLMKRALLQKINELFGNISREMIKEVEIKLAGSRLLNTIPRISRGENYEGLPYIMLDYPALFEKEDIIAIRTMFWWGKFVSVTLHVTGRYKRLVLSGNGFLDKITAANFYLSINSDQWQHHFEPGNYQLVKDLSTTALDQALQAPFVKIARQLPISELQKSESFILEVFNELLGLISFPVDGIDPLPANPTNGSDL